MDKQVVINILRSMEDAGIQINVETSDGGCWSNIEIYGDNGDLFTHIDLPEDGVLTIQDIIEGLGGV